MDAFGLGLGGSICKSARLALGCRFSNGEKVVKQPCLELDIVNLFVDVSELPPEHRPSDHVHQDWQQKRMAAIDIEFEVFQDLHHLAHLSRGIAKEAGGQPCLGFIGQCHAGERLSEIWTLAYNLCSISASSTTTGPAGRLTHLLSVAIPSNVKSQRNVLPSHKVKWVALAHAQLIQYLAQEMLVLKWHRGIRNLLIAIMLVRPFVDE